MEHSKDLELPVFDQLESVTTDPVIERAFSKAREFEEMINYLGNTTREERDAMINELDAEWPYLGTTLKVSGNASFASSLESEVRKKYYDETEMLSDGFCFIPNDLTHEGETITEQFRVGLHFIKQEDNDPNRRVTGFGTFDELLIEYPTNSPEMVERRLRYFHGDIIETLDCIILNCDTEEEALMAIGEFSLNISVNDEEDLQLLTDIQNYISVLLEFDEDLPYRFNMVGRMYIRGDSILKPVDIEQEYNGLARISSIQFLPKDITKPLDVVQEMVPCVDMNVYRESKGIQPQRLMVPVTSIGSVSSLRRETYEPTKEG